MRRSSAGSRIYEAGNSESYMEPIVKTEDLSVIYGLGKTNQAYGLKNVNIEILPEEYIVIFGPSGSGKSTLLNVIAGLEPPTRGRISIEGQDIYALKPFELARFHQVSMGMIFQAYNLITSLNVLDNVTLPQVFQGEAVATRTAKAMSLLERFGIAAFAKRLPQELSGGQQQRVSVCRALINDARLLLADEPTGNLDSKSSQNVMDILSSLNKEYKKTIILVTHDPQCLHYADKVLYVRDGAVVKETSKEKKKEMVDEGTAAVSISKNLEELSRIHPDLSEAKIKAKALANYLLSSYEEEEIDRFESAIEARLLGNIGTEKFRDFLHRPFEEGGVGLYKQTADKFSHRVEAVMSEVELLHSVNAEEGAPKKISPIDIRVQDMRHYLLDTYEGSLGKEEDLIRFDAILRSRITGEIGKKEFERVLFLSATKGGVGLSRRTARNFSRRLELVLVL